MRLYCVLGRTLDPLTSSSFPRHYWRMLSAVDTRCRQLSVWSVVWLVRRRGGQNKVKSLLLRPNALLVGFKQQCENWVPWSLIQLTVVWIDNVFSPSGDVLLATAFLSYSGPFNQEFRNLLMNDWKRELKQRHIPFGNNLNLTDLLIDAPTVGEWNLQVQSFLVCLFLLFLFQHYTLMFWISTLLLCASPSLACALNPARFR